jgi:hypothetical protein
MPPESKSKPGPQAVHPELVQDVQLALQMKQLFVVGSRKAPAIQTWQVAELSQVWHKGGQLGTQVPELSEANVNPSSHTEHVAESSQVVQF